MVEHRSERHVSWMSQFSVNSEARPRSVIRSACAAAGLGSGTNRGVCVVEEFMGGARFAVWFHAEPNSAGRRYASEHAWPVLLQQVGHLANLGCTVTTLRSTVNNSNTPQTQRLSSQPASEPPTESARNGGLRMLGQRMAHGTWQSDKSNPMACAF